MADESAAHPTLYLDPSPHWLRADATSSALAAIALQLQALAGHSERVATMDTAATSSARDRHGSSRESQARRPVQRVDVALEQGAREPLSTVHLFGRQKEP
jgi:hypothetical protein